MTPQINVALWHSVDTDRRGTVRGNVDPYGQYNIETAIAADLRFKTATLDRVPAGWHDERHSPVGKRFCKPVRDSGSVIGMCSVIRVAKRDAQWRN